MPIIIWPFGSNCRILKRYLFFFWEQFKEKNVFAYCLCCQRLRQTKQKNGNDYFIELCVSWYIEFNYSNAKV